MIFFFLYVTTILLINLGFTHVPLVDIGFGVFIAYFRVEVRFV